MTGTLTVRIARSDPDAPAEFRIETFHPMTVLDALLAVQREHEPSLGFRFSCRVAMCGTCTLRVDGRSALACQAVIPRGATKIRLDPAAGMPVVRDLIVDTTPFWEQWSRITPYVVPDATARTPARIEPDSPERRAIDPALDCIQCGACFSSCGIAGSPRTFLGPAALNRALVLINDSRDTATRERLELVDGPDGVDRCHYIYGCTGACPKNLDPAAAIRHLRKKAAHAVRPRPTKAPEETRGATGETLPPRQGDADETLPPRQGDADETLPPRQGNADETLPPRQGNADETLAPRRGDAGETLPPRQGATAETLPPRRGDAGERLPSRRGDAGETRAARLFRRLRGGGGSDAR